MGDVKTLLSMLRSIQLYPLSSSLFPQSPATILHNISGALIPSFKLNANSLLQDQGRELASWRWSPATDMDQVKQSIVTQEQIGRFRAYHRARGEWGAGFKYLLKLIPKHICKNKSIYPEYIKTSQKATFHMIPFIRSPGIGTIARTTTTKRFWFQGLGWCIGAVWGDIWKERTVLFLDGEGGYITKCICLSFWFIRWKWTWEFAFRTSSQEILAPVVWGTYFENHCPTCCKS